MIGPGIFCACGCERSLEGRRDGTIWYSEDCRTEARARDRAAPALSDCDRILGALQEAPGRTLTNNQLSRMLWPNQPCKALHSRIAELRKRGHSIPPAKRVRKGVYRYKLTDPKSARSADRGQSQEDDLSRPLGGTGRGERSGPAPASRQAGAVATDPALPAGREGEPVHLFGDAVGKTPPRRYSDPESEAA